MFIYFNRGIVEGSFELWTSLLLHNEDLEFTLIWIDPCFKENDFSHFIKDIAAPALGFYYE